MDPPSQLEVDMVNQLAEALAFDIWGVIRTNPHHCVCHDLPQSEAAFRDALSAREFEISGLCQATQDEVFTDPEG
jgi:hypothetical protein